jgi:tetratricopeptide (TPR) repeat protein
MSIFRLLMIASLIVMGMVALSACGAPTATTDTPAEDMTGDADAVFQRGVEYYQQGNFDEAIEAFSDAILLHPDDPDLYINRGSAYTSKRNFDAAIADYDKAIALNPEYAEAYAGRGAVYYFQEKIDLAIADYDRAIELKPDFTGALFNRGTLYKETGQTDQAIADFQKVLEIGDDLFWQQQAEQALAGLESGGEPATEEPEDEAEE